MSKKRQRKKSGSKVMKNERITLKEEDGSIVTKPKKVKLDKISVMVVESKEALNNLGVSILDKLKVCDIVIDRVIFLDRKELVFVVGRNEKVAQNVYELLRSNGTYNLGVPIKTKAKTYFHIEKNVDELTALLERADIKVSYYNEPLGQAI